MSRLNGVLGLFIGLFGAMAIVGVFFKIAKYPHWEILMAVGFIGEAAAFVIMGLFALIAGFTANGIQDGRSRSDASPDVAATAAALSSEATEEFRKELRATVHSFGEHLQRHIAGTLERDFDVAVRAVSEQAHMTREEMRLLGDSLGAARGAVDGMRQALAETASGQLADDAERLGTGMRVVARSMENASDSVEEVNREVMHMAQRFRAFNGSALALQPNHKPADKPGIPLSASF